MTPLDPDLRAFAQSGGKFLLWHGWTDGAISPLDSIGYYESVVETMGKREADESVRLFLMPGVDHCEGGEGPDQVDFLSALVKWVEEDIAPSESSPRSRWATAPSAHARCVHIPVPPTILARKVRTTR